MGRIHAIKRALFANDHFRNDYDEIEVQSEVVFNGLSVFDEWPNRLPEWCNNSLLFVNGGAFIKKKLKTHNEWFSIAVDFDGIINPYPPKKPFPFMDNPDSDVVKIINRLFIEGFCIIIWTVRGGKLIKPLREYLHNNKILFHYINENPEFDLKYKNLSRKIAASVYWDDRNIFHVDAPFATYDEIIKKYNNSLPVDPRQCGVGIEPNT